MSKNTMKHIFDKFYQWRYVSFQRGKRTGDGNGKTGAGAYGWGDSGLSEEKQGSTFIVTLPMAGKEFGQL